MPPSATNPFALREALLRALVSDAQGRLRPGVRLLRHDDEEAALLLPYSGECLVLRSLQEGDAAGADMLRQRLAALRSAARGSRLGVAVVGGGVDARRLLAEATPFAGLGSPLTLFHVSDDGRLWCSRLFGGVVRTTRPVLSHALQRVRSGAALEPLTPQQREALVLAAAPAAPTVDAPFWSAYAGVTPWASWTIGLVVALIFALEVFWGGWGVLSGGAATGPTLIRMGANIRERVLAGELDRILSSAFLHIGLLHLVVNLWALRVFGPFLERILGASRFVVLYAVSALAGGLASFAFGRYSFSAGASGALWGLMVGGFALSVWPRGLLPEAVRHQLQTRGWQPLAVNILISFSGNIDRYAHFGGGLAGGALIASGLLSWGVRRRGDPAPEGGALLFRGLAAALAVLMAASVASALARGRPWELRSPPEPLRRVALPGTPVALSVPPGLALEAAAGDSVAGEPEGTRAFVIGDGYSDPLTLWVTVRPGVVPLEALRARLATAAPAELHLQGTPRIVMLDGRPAVTARLEGPELTRTTWILFQSDHVVQLDADCITGAAAAWCRLGERIARSVGAAGP